MIVDPRPDLTADPLRARAVKVLCDLMGYALQPAIDTVDLLDDEEVDEILTAARPSSGRIPAVSIAGVLFLARRRELGIEAAGQGAKFDRQQTDRALIQDQRTGEFACLRGVD